MNLSNLTLTNKKRSSNSKKQHVYDKQYALSMLNYFQKNSSVAEAICYTGWVMYRGLLSSIAVKNSTSNQTATSLFALHVSSRSSNISDSRYAKDNVEDVALRISPCWARNKEVIFGARSPFAAGFNILSNARYQGIESMLFTSDMKTIAYGIFQIVTKLLENRKKDAAFVKFLGFEILGEKQFYEVNTIFTSEVQTLIEESFKDISNVSNESSLSELVFAVRRVYQLGISVWINTPSLQIKRTDSFGGHSVNRLILEPLPYFDFYMKWANLTNSVEKTDKFNWPGSRSYNASYNCGAHVIYYPMHFTYVPRYSSGDTLWTVDAATFGQSITNTLYDILMDPTVAKFHGFIPVSLDAIFLDSCLRRIESQLKKVTSKYNLTYDPNNFKRLLFGYLVLSEFNKIPQYNIGGLIKIIVGTWPLEVVQIAKFTFESPLSPTMPISIVATICPLKVVV
ncbi:uncharacterized protein LOC142344356 [Convolutriloba macropyga]|uniref:uncharacterized protein LOC142344356 n=1 Tax=Convolutriloba macropyga TaxID=536237 RepID=UPI003F525CC0